jgi:hypothetical protein
VLGAASSRTGEEALGSESLLHRIVCGRFQDLKSPPTTSSTAIGTLYSGGSNSVTKVTYRFPVAGRLDIALLVCPSMV